MCPSTRVAAVAEVAAVAIRDINPVSPTIPSHNGIQISLASMAAVFAIVHVPVPVPVPDRVSIIHSIIQSMSTPVPVAPMRAAFIAMVKPGHTTYPYGPQSEHRTSRASCSDSPAGNPATVCPPMAATIGEGVTIRAWSEATQCMSMGSWINRFPDVLIVLHRF